jgi:hypothetical protein
MKETDLSGRWTLVRASTGETCPAAVPGDTHSALLACPTVAGLLVQGEKSIAFSSIGSELSRRGGS